MMIVGSVYDRYGPCSTCGALGGSPCVNLLTKHRLPLRVGSAHRGRVIHDDSSTEQLVDLVDLGWCIRCKRRLIPPGRRKLCSAACQRARNREQTSRRRRRRRAGVR